MEHSHIEWTDHSFNAWLGCTKVSPACDHCYAERWSKRNGANARLWQGERRRTTVGNWRQPRKWDREAARHGIRYRVFCASLADVFDNQVVDEWRTDLWDLIASTPHLDWLLLTKRPQNIRKMLPSTWGSGWSNVWMGTTVENVVEARRRIPHLVAIPAPVRFLSCEPLLEPITPDPAGINWVICGGETGHGAREMNADWARSLHAQCADADIPFFTKQMTKKAAIPDDLLVRQFPASAG